MIRKGISILVLLLFQQFSLFAHQEWVHQHMVKEAYKLLKRQLGSDIPIMKDRIGLDLSGPGSGTWETGKVVIGAWREDIDDPVWNVGGIRCGLVASSTHFWDADDENSLEWLPHTCSREKSPSYLRIVALERMVADIHENIDENTQLHNKFSARLKGGLKFSESGHPGTEKGWWFSLGIRIPVSSFWSIEGEFLYWRSPSRFPLVREVISVDGYSLFVSYSRPISKSTAIVLFIGPGLAKSVKKSSGHPDFSAETTGGLVTLNAGLAATTAISEEWHLVTEIRQLRAATPTVGGGDHYTPWLLGAGIQIAIPRFRAQ